MTTPPTHHRVTIVNRFGNAITAAVVRVKDMGNGVAEVDVETTFHIEEGHDHHATYIVPSHEAKGSYKVGSKRFTVQLTYIYSGIFTRK